MIVLVESWIRKVVVSIRKSRLHNECGCGGLTSVAVPK